jgi:hypothetical protein
MKRLVVAFVAAVALVGCGGSSNPLNPSKNDKANLRVGVDGATCAGIGNVSVFIDGLSVGKALPGGAGVTKEVGIGEHMVSGTVDLYPDYGWKPSAISVGESGALFTLSC